jgi:hypothetical protein
MNRNGWEGLFKIGPAGVEAPTAVPLRRDINYEVGMELADNSSAGDGVNIPVHDARPVKLVPKLTVNMILNDADATHVTITAAACAATPTPLAVRLKHFATGKGLNADCYVSMKLGLPYQGETTFDFEFTPTTDAGRAIQTNV